MMAILDPHVQIKLALMFDEMWSDFLDGTSEELEEFLETSQLTELFEPTQEEIDTGEHDCEVGDTMRRLNADGEAVIRLAEEAKKQSTGGV